MAAGGPGDDPVSDILVYGLPVYSPDTDDLVRRIARFVSRERLGAMVDWFNPPPLPELNKILVKRLDQLERQARADGWEVD